MSSCNLQPDFLIICLTETWLNESTAPLISLPGYNFVYKNRLDKLGGGTGLFIKNDIHFISHEDYNANNDTCENLCIEIVNKNFRNILLFVIYRPPNSNPTLFLEYLNNLLGKLHPNKITYIVGDFNIDLLKNDCHNISTDFTNILYSHSFFLLIHLPTRVTKSSATLIDNIFCNHLTPHDSGVIVSDFSDHYPIFTTFKNIKTYSSDIIDNQKHNFSPNNIKNLQTFLESFNWEEILLISNVNEGFAKFNDILQNSINQFCPVQSIKAKKKKQPWMTSGLLISSIKKNKLYKKYISNPSSSNKIFI